ncbi:glycosyltransferase family 2 protein [Novosphingobium lentum]|uniref:glycosyltransferase family 2 protein n=1 Tax=Novosphingobium lentum TaxID=145287 RepID=UPI00082BF7EC|nr:glycosyltransferase family A protein [Novosphingobium lentum]
MPGFGEETRAGPAVTVVVPAYNAESFILRTLESALGQTYANLEVVVVDDGSTDDTRALCEGLMRPHPGLRILGGPNRGVAGARNAGTQAACSPLVAYLDADDLWHPTKIERQVAAFLRHGLSSEWVANYTLHRMIDAEDRVLGDGAPVSASGDFFVEHLQENHVNNGSSILIRRDVALAVGGFDPTYAARGIGGCEDYDFQLKVLQAGKMELIPEYLVGYRTYPGNMSSNHLAMGLGLLAVIEKFAASPRVTPAEREDAILRAHGNAVLRFVKARDGRRIAQSMKVMLATEPRRTAAFLADVATRTGSHLIDRRRPIRPQPFHELQPDEPFGARPQAAAALPVSPPTRATGNS